MTFELQPTLTGDLVKLRPLRSDEFDVLFAAASDPLIWEQHPEQTRYKREVFQKFFHTAIESGGAFAVVDRKTGRVIGSTRYWNYKSEESEIEIGWTFLERAYWGGVYNAEMKRLMLEHAFRFVERVVFVVGENNMRSRKAVEKIGGKFWKYADRLGPDGSRNVVFAIERPK